MSEKVYIEFNGNTPIGSEHNMAQLQKRFPDHDFSTGLPPNFAELVKAERPVLNRFWKAEIVKLRKVDDKFIEEINVRPMTADEKAIEIAIKTKNFHMTTGFYSWTYNEETDQFLPPFPVPEAIADKGYIWNKSQGRWDIVE